MDPNTPFFGAKISLVSKSEIRYEGTLYTIDPRESTIALAKVRSFGTEDRPAERQVPPRDEIFEFIIFRASDIKDLVVDEEPTNGGPVIQPFVDPAIVKSGQQQPLPPVSSGPSSSTSSQPQSSTQSKPADNGQVPQVDSTKKSQPTQAPKPAWGGINQVNNNNNTSSSSQSQQPQQQQQQQQQNRSQPANRSNNQVRPQLDHQNRRDNNSFNNQHQGGRVGNNASGSGGGGFRLQGHPPGQHGGFRGQSNFGSQGRFNSQRGGGNGVFQRGGRGGGFGQSRGGFVQRNVPIKFAPLPDGEFDFEKAHSDFQMLEEKLKSLKMGGDAGSDQELPPIEGIPASAITVSALEEEEISKEPCYNKTKSFFDTISCEAIEREKGNVKRVDWKAERSMNKETFGVSSARPNQRYFNNNRRGGYGFNNRGGGFGRGRGGGGYHRRYPTNHNQNRQSGSEDPVVASPSVEASA